jgi:hypothetical protein
MQVAQLVERTYGSYYKRRIREVNLTVSESSDIEISGSPNHDVGSNPTLYSF